MTIREYCNQKRPNYTAEEIRRRLEEGKGYVPDRIKVALIEQKLEQAENEYGKDDVVSLL